MSDFGNVTPTEIMATQYYVHKSYVNSYYHVYKYIENWFAEKVFRNDKSRVFLASDDYCFRRRFELTDMSKDYSTLDFTSLRLPFANYSPLNVGWQADDRFAANNASMVYNGLYVGNTKLRAASGYLNIPVTLWFDREDDARFAYDRLYFYSFNRHSGSVKVPYGRDNTVDTNDNSQPTNVLELPTILQVKTLTFNPQFKEKDWLNKQRVFTIKCEVQVLSYMIYPPEQPNYDITMNADGTLSDGSTYEDGISFYHIVDDVILNLSNGKDTKVQTFDAGFNPVEQSYCGSKRFPEVGEIGVIYVDSHCEDEDLGKNRPVKMYVWDEYNERYITPEYGIDCHSIRYNGEYTESNLDITKLDFISDVTQNSNTISWSYGSDETKDMIDGIEIHLYNHKDIISVDPSETSYVLDGLQSHSQYYGYMVFFSKDGSSKRFVINFVTPMSKSDEEDRKAPLNSLVGITW